MSDQQSTPQIEKEPVAARAPAGDADYPYAPQPGNPSFPSPPPDASLTIDKLLPWLPLLLLAAMGMAAHFAVLPLMEVFGSNDWGALWVYASAGVMLAQAGAISAFQVWTRGRFWVRLTLHWAVGAMGVAALSLGAIISGDFEPELICFLFSLPALALAVQLPLWITRVYLGWHFLAAATAPVSSAHYSASEREPLSIRDFFIGTLLVAVSLGFLRVAASIEDDIWIVMAVAMPSVMIATALSVIPIGRLLTSEFDWRLGVVLIALETLIAAIVVVAAVYWMETGARAWDLFGIATIVFAFAATLSAAALAARFAGYRLQTNRSAP